MSRQRAREQRLPVVTPPEIKGPDSEPLGCWKRRFATQAAAQGAPSSRPMRAYHCVLCDSWHRTEKLHVSKGVH